MGLSALLVSTSKQMQYFVEYAKQNNMKIPVTYVEVPLLIAAYINRIAKEGGVYTPGIFYCKTAFDGSKDHKHTNV